jgi:hypothetical protein
VAPTPAPAPAAASAPEEVETPSTWRLTLRPLAEAGRLRVFLETPDADVARWKLPKAALSLVDVGEGSIRYEVTPTPDSPCVFEVTPSHAVFCGAAVLPKATGDDAQREIEIRLASDGGFYPAAASSFGLATTTRVTTSFAELRRAGFLYGDVHHARFDAAVGRDHAAWLGYFSFDPRWVAAEAAGVRTAVDRWLGIRRPKKDPTVGLLFSGIADTSQRIDIRALHRGALIQAGPSARWSVRARLDLTRQLVQRTIGGAITVDGPGAQWWFDEGVAHGIALRVLVDVGVLTREEAAAEVSSWLAEEALSPHAGTALDAVVAQGDTATARRLLAMRGALLAVALPGRGLQRASRMLLGQQERRLPRAAFFAVAGERAETLRTAFEAGDPIPVRASDVGPCLAMVQRRVHAFDIGFTKSSGGGSVATVDPAGPAARAGVRVGDGIVSLDYVEGRSDVAAQIQLKRGDVRLSVAFHPRGPGRRARAFTIASRSGTCAL